MSIDRLPHVALRVADHHTHRHPSTFNLGRIDLDESGSVHVLMNGGFVGHLQTMSPDSPRISFYSSPTNLGVAGGRNFLLRLPEIQDSDVIVVLDNDVIDPIMRLRLERLRVVEDADHDVYLAR